MTGAADKKDMHFHRRVSLAAVLSIGLLFPGIVQADPGRTLSLVEAVRYARERNPAFSMSKLQYESARLTYLKTLHSLGWVESFTASSTWNRDESFDYKIYNTTTSRRSTYSQLEKFDSKSSWNLKSTRASGMTVDFYSKLNGNRSNTKYRLVGQAESLTDQTANKYRYTGVKMNPEVGVNLTLPMLGEGKNSGLQSKQVAEAVWAQAETDYDESKKQLVLSVRQGYYDLLLARDMTTLRKMVLAEAEDRLEVTKKRLSVGIATELDVSQAELAVLSDRADLADAIFTEQQSLSRLNSSIGLPLDEYYDLTDSFPAPPSEELTLKGVQGKVVSQSNSLKRINKDVEQAAITLTQAKSKLEPTLSFTSTLAMEGERRSFRKVLRDPEPKYSFGLSYEFPFGEKVVEKADVELAQATLSEKVIERDDLSQSLILDATETYQELLKVQQRLAIARQSSAVARRSLVIVQAKYDEGRAEITDVITAKEALVNAQVEELNNLYSLAVTLAQLEIMIGDAG